MKLARKTDESASDVVGYGMVTRCHQHCGGATDQFIDRIVHPCCMGDGDEKQVCFPEEFGDLITADHTVLNEGCESRNNHRYAVVVQDLATQWIQSYPCKTKTSQETEKS